MWHADIDDWTEVYDRRLKTWLQAIEKSENDSETGLNGITMSVYMKESWETGRFWMNYAARKSWAFDIIFWKYLDQRFFGSREHVPYEDLWKTRVHLLSEKEQSVMTSFVERKMEESKERILVEYSNEEVKKRLAKVLYEEDFSFPEDMMCLPL